MARRATGTVADEVVAEAVGHSPTPGVLQGVLNWVGGLRLGLGAAATTGHAASAAVPAPAETTLHFRVLQAVSGELVAEGEVPASTTVKALRSRLTPDIFQQHPRGRARLLAQGELLGDNSPLADLAQDGAVELQLVRLPGPRLEPAPAGMVVDHRHVIRLILVGDPGVGKTSMMLDFLGHEAPSYGVELETKFFQMDDSVNIRVEVWDMAGAERFPGVIRLHYLGAQGVLIVFDVTNPNSFDRVRGWVEDVRAHVNAESVLALVGSKADRADRVVSQEEAMALASSAGVLYFESAVKLGRTSAIERLLEEVLARTFS